MMTDPAQSAPSAEPPIDSAEEWLRIQSLNGRKLLLTSQQQPSDSPYMNVQQAMEAYAALRTAQQSLQNEELLSAYRARQKYLEDTIADLETKHSNIIKMQAGMFREKRDELLTRAETAESALRDAREKAIQECAAFLEQTASLITPGTFNKFCIDTLNESANGLRALLTVAAQTPEEK